MSKPAKKAKKANGEYNDFLNKKAATPAERKIYEFMASEYKKSGASIQNHQIAKKTKKYRTTVLFHLTNMIEKKMVKRHGKQYYTPIFPE